MLKAKLVGLNVEGDSRHFFSFPGLCRTLTVLPSGDHHVNLACRLVWRRVSGSQKPGRPRSYVLLCVPQSVTIGPVKVQTGSLSFLACLQLEAREATCCMKSQ